MVLVGWVELGSIGGVCDVTLWGFWTASWGQEIWYQRVEDNRIYKVVKFCVFSVWVCGWVGDGGGSFAVVFLCFPSSSRMVQGGGMLVLFVCGWFLLLLIVLI